VEAAKKSAKLEGFSESGERLNHALKPSEDERLIAAHLARDAILRKKIATSGGGV